MGNIEDDILKDFLAESNENLELLDQQFVELEQEPDNEELIKSIFRTIHTIKGTSGFFGFTTLEGIAHFAEDILSKLRDGVVCVDEEITTILLQSVDYIKAILGALDQTGNEPDDIEYLDFIVDLRNFSEKIVKNQGSASSTSPEKTADKEEDRKEDKKEEKEEDHTETAQDEVPGNTEGKDADAGKKTTGSEALEDKAEKEVKKEPEMPDKKAAGSGPRKSLSPPSGAHHLAETHVRIDVQLLDQLMTLAGELVLSRNRLTQIANNLNNPELGNANQHMSLVVTELQEQIMKTRMQPIGNVFNKFPRIVRDLARTAEKQVQLNIKGAETELDRSIIESIKDPLTHMVRNSIDHGIEAPELRIQHEKPAAGNLAMRAYHEGGQVIIEISDDGAGIDPENLKTKSVEKELITQEQADSMSDREALMLIFQPGFSTAKKVTNISGRGVGMDVVKTNIEKLGGTVELNSKVGAGTTVKIKIPLTLAIIPALIVHSAGQRYAIPQVNLVELVHLSMRDVENDVQIIGDSEFYRLRGNILPLVRLRKVLGDPPSEEKSRSMNIVVLNAGDQPFGLVVDAISDSEEIVVKPLGSHLKHIPAFAGTTLMGDGRVALIIDITGVAAFMQLKGDDAMRQASIIAGTGMDEERQFLLLCSIAPDEFFALPLALVNRLDKISASEIEYVGGREVIQYRGHSMPVIRMENFLPISPLPEQEEYHLIVFNMNDKDVAFLVSRIEDSLDVAIDVEEHTFKQEGILGSAIIKDRTTLFIDVYQVIEMHDPDFFDKPDISEAGNTRILLAEDSAFYRNLLSSYLAAAGYQVTACEDGAQAWNTICSDTFDLVITDIEMPNMDGFELIKNIRSHDTIKEIPVIAVTSLAGEDDRRRGMEAGFNEYQPKLDRAEVLSAVSDLLASVRDIEMAA